LIHLLREIYTAGRKWVAANETKESKEGSFYYSIPLNRKDGIFGAGGIKSAGWRKKRGDNLLVETEKREGHFR
jgi:hypothetical protein